MEEFLNAIRAHSCYIAERVFLEQQSIRVGIEDGKHDAAVEV